MDPQTAEKFKEFLGRDPHPSGAGRERFVIQQPAYPQWRFEWHPQSRKVYLIRLNARPLAAEIIAEHAETYAAGFGAVQTWLRGYHEGRTPDIPKTHLEG